MPYISFYYQFINMKAQIVAFALLVLVGMAYALKECPEKFEDEVVQLANPEDCGSFFKCNEAGKPILHKCPTGLKYNEKLGVCDWPENVTCNEPESDS